jgi:hypothetical protein
MSTSRHTIEHRRPAGAAANATEAQAQRAFDLLMRDLQALLSPSQVEQVHAMLASWAGQAIYVPHIRRWQKLRARALAAKMVSDGLPPPVVRDRLIEVGICRASAYRLIAEARNE